MRKLVPTLLLFTSGCFADSVVNIVFTNLPSTNYAGTYNGITTATVGTNSSGHGGVAGDQLICDDGAHNTNVPSGVLPYDYSTINVATNLGSDTMNPGASGDPRFQPSNSNTAASFGETQVQMYEEAAVIIYNLTQIYSTASAETIAQYQYALWNLMNPIEGVFTSSNDGSNATADNSAVGTIQSTAKTDVNAKTSLDRTIYSELVIYTPTTADASNQEWLQLQPCPTPEPSTIGMAGMVLFGMGFVAWRRRRAQATV